MGIDVPQEEDGLEHVLCVQVPLYTQLPQQVQQTRVLESLHLLAKIRDTPPPASATEPTPSWGPCSSLVAAFATACCVLCKCTMLLRCLYTVTCWVPMLNGANGAHHGMAVCGKRLDQ